MDLVLDEDQVRIEIAITFIQCKIVYIYKYTIIFYMYTTITII